MAMGPATQTEPADIHYNRFKGEQRSNTTAEQKQCLLLLLLLSANFTVPSITRHIITILLVTEIDLMEQSEQVPPRDVITGIGTFGFFLANPNHYKTRSIFY